MGLFTGTQLVFYAAVSFRVRYGAPQVRNTRKFRVSHYDIVELLSRVRLPEVCTTAPSVAIREEYCEPYVPS